MKHRHNAEHLRAADAAQGPNPELRAPQGHPHGDRLSRARQQREAASRPSDARGLLCATRRAR